MVLNLVVDQQPILLAVENADQGCFEPADGEERDIKNGRPFLAVRDFQCRRKRA